MKEDWYRVIGWILVAIVALCGVAAALHILVNVLPRSGAADWVVAVGTIGTLVGTIWLATSQRRVQRRQDFDRAFVAIAATESRITKVYEALDRAVEHFTDELSRNNGFKYEIQANLVENAGMWTDDQILPLIVLPNHVCAKLAATRPIIADCVKMMRELEITQSYSWVQESKAEYDRKLLVPLLRCRNTLRICLDECHAFATRSGYL